MAEVPKDGESDCSFEDRRERNRDEKKDANVNVSITAMSRKEKRKALKKMKRKQLRREKAMKEREEEEARLNNPEELMRLQRLEQEEAERMERDRMAFEERERKFLEALELKKKREQEEEEQRRKLSEESQSKLVENENASKADEDDDWEYVEEGPAEIIWKGNEIIVKKKKVRVPKKSLEIENTKQESERPISNPLAPQSEAFEDYKSAQEVLESVAQQVPNFGTEQDKAHCPFHLKTGVCRFGARCSRVHFYPDKACTLLMKNMYSGPGLAWEQDEGLEYTEDEVEQSFEEFYEDVHTEFLKFGEIVNFKVCKNSSSHLRGNVYVHYKSLESAVLACQSINGRYFAGKQISCEFVNVTRWKVAICGEYMKSRLKTCSRGSACNFIHCFRNPGGDYEWADWDKPAPGYWLKKMAALFGYPADRLTGEVSPRYGSRRSRSRGPNSAHGRSHSDEDVDWKRERHRRHRERSKERTANPDEEMHEEKMSSVRYHHSKRRRHDTFGTSDGSSDEQRSDACRKRSRKRERDPEIAREDRKIRQHEADSGKPVKRGESERYHEHDRGKRRKRGEELDVDRHSRGNVGEVDPRENSDTDGHHDRYRRHKSRHSPDKKKDSNSSDIDSHGVRLDRDKHRHHSRSKRSSRHMKNESDTSDSASIEDVGRERRRREKNGRNSRSRNESYFMDIESSQERLSRDDRSSGHRRRNSRHHNEESELSNAIFNAQKYHRGRDSPEEDNLTESHNYGNHGKRSSQDVASNKSFEAEEDNGNYDVGNRQEINERKEEATPSQTVEASGSHSSSLETNRESESERELAYRLAPLKKLEEMRKSKDPQPAHGIHGNVAAVGGDEDASKDSKQQCSVSSKVEPSTASTRRRRI